MSPIGGPGGIGGPKGPSGPDGPDALSDELHDLDGALRPATTAPVGGADATTGAADIGALSAEVAAGRLTPRAGTGRRDQHSQAQTTRPGPSCLAARRACST